MLDIMDKLFIPKTKLMFFNQFGLTVFKFKIFELCGKEIGLI